MAPTHTSWYSETPTQGFRKEELVFRPLQKGDAGAKIKHGP